MRLIMCEQKSVVGRERYILNRAATAAKDTKDWSLPSFGSHLNPISTRGGQIMPTLYWGPWLTKIRRGGPAFLTGSCNGHKNS